MSVCIGTHVKWLSRYVVLFKISDKTAKDFINATVLSLGKIPEGKRESLTVNNEKEFAIRREICTKSNCKVYFADSMLLGSESRTRISTVCYANSSPGKPFFAGGSQQDVEAIALLLNRHPRKCLGWKSPKEVFFSKSLNFT